MMSIPTKNLENDLRSLIRPDIRLLANLELEGHDTFLQRDHENEQ